MIRRYGFIVITAAALLLHTAVARSLLAQRAADPERPIFSFRRTPVFDPSDKRVGEWIAAVESHSPGTMDRSLQTIANWPQPEVEEVVADIEHRVASGRMTRRLLATAAGQTTAAALLNRGVVLHTDIAALSFLTTPDVAANVPIAALHLGAAMALADFIQGEQHDSPLPMAWYRTALAILESNHEVLVTAAFAERAVLMFRGDLDLLVMAGCAREMVASPRVQDAADFIRDARGRYGDEAANLRRAAQYYGEALKLAPDSVETHMRLGRVLSRLGQHDQALEHMKVAARADADVEIRYFATLFLGEELAATGDMAGARVAYDHAHALFPDARSIHLALSRLARQDGDIDGAVATVRETFDLGGGADPIWNRYYVAALARQADAVLDRFRTQFGVPVAAEVKRP